MSEATNISTCIESTFGKNSSECHHLPCYFITFSYAINLILGFPANCYILWLSMKEMIRGQSLEVFVFNISLTEVIFNFSFPFVIKKYFYNCSYCRYATTIFGLVISVGRPLFLTFICAERYLGVLHPVTFLKLKPMKYRIAITIIGWILIICSCILVILEVTDMHNLLLAECITFLIIKVFTCLMVLKVLRHPGPGVNRDKVKAFRIIQIVLVSSLLMYGPVITFLVLYYIFDYNMFLMSWSVSTCLGIMLGFVQPFLYLKRIKKCL